VQISILAAKVQFCRCENAILPWKILGCLFTASYFESVMFLGSDCADKLLHYWAERSITLSVLCSAKQWHTCQSNMECSTSCRIVCYMPIQLKNGFA